MPEMMQSFPRAVAITTSNTVNIDSGTSRIGGLYVGTASTADVVLVFDDGATVTLKNVIAGTFYPIHFIRINATGTTASNLVAFLEGP